MTLAEMNFFQRMLYILSRYSGSLVRGAATTMAIALICTALGCVIGFAVGLVQTIEPQKKDGAFKRAVLKVVKVILNIYVEVFRGTPMMLQAAFIYYGASSLFNINLGMWTAAIIIVSVNTGAYMAETVRGGILSVDPGQKEGARAKRATACLEMALASAVVISPGSGVGGTIAELPGFGVSPTEEVRRTEGRTMARAKAQAATAAEGAAHFQEKNFFFEGAGERSGGMCLTRR